MRFLFAFCIISALTICCVANFGGRSANAQEAATPVTARKTFALEINNKAGLVTVREKGGAYRFAQVVTTPDLHIDLNMVAKSRVLQLTLRDENNKPLWRTTLGDGGEGKFGFEWKKSSVDDPAVILSITPSDAATLQPPDEMKYGMAKGHIVIGNDNVLSLASFSDETNEAFRVERRNEAMVVLTAEEGKLVEKLRMSFDDKTKTTTLSGGGTVLTVNNGDQKASTMKDSIGTITLRTETRDGKTYQVLDLGNRRILIEGQTLQCSLGEDGELFLTILPVTK